MKNTEKYEYELVNNRGTIIQASIATREVARTVKASYKEEGVDTKIVQKIYSLVSKEVVR